MFAVLISPETSFQTHPSKALILPKHLMWKRCPLTTHLRVLQWTFEKRSLGFARSAGRFCQCNEWCFTSWNSISCWRDGPLAGSQDFSIMCVALSFVLWFYASHFSLFSIDVYKLLQESQGRGDGFEVVFMLFCLRIEVKEIAVQAKKFLSSAVHLKGPIWNPCVMGSYLYQLQ